MTNSSNPSKQPKNGYNMEEIALCKSCVTMKHLNADGICRRCAPQLDLTIEELLCKVRDAGAVDDNNGAEDWSHSDLVIDKAHAAIKRLVLEGRMDECLNERNAMEPSEANGVPYVPHFDAYTSGRLRYLDDEIAALNSQIERK